MWALLITSLLAYNLGNFLRRLGKPRVVWDWSLRSPSAEGRSFQVKLIKICGRLVRHARRPVVQLAETAVPREVFAARLRRAGAHWKACTGTRVA